MSPREVSSASQISTEVIESNTAMVTVAPAILPSRRSKAAANDAAVDDLKANIERLSELHSKLHFMLAELEELVGVKRVE